MKKIFFPVLFLCLPGAAASALGPGLVAQDGQESSNSRYGITYQLKQQEGGLVEVDLFCEGFQAKGLKVERLNALDESRGIMAAGAGPQSTGIPHRLKLRFGSEHAVDGALLLRIREMSPDSPSLVLRISLVKKEAFGKIHFERGVSGNASLIRRCDTWCSFVWMECTSGGYIEACCDQASQVIYDDANCKIICTSCTR